VSGKITRVEHRHSDQKQSDPDLVLEVGKPLPPFYQVGRPRGVLVASISGSDPVTCTLINGDVIFVGAGNVRKITRETSDA